jgi:two-component system cell cycle response regulator
VASRILVIEDNPTSLELMSYLLQAYGHTVSTACDGVEGLEAARREAPDLIICDIQLPRMDGQQVARQLSGDPELGSIPRVAVTALAMVGDRDRVLASGFAGYIPKPIHPETFVQQVESFLPHHLHALPPSPPRSPSVPPPSKPRPCRGRILIVDDTPANLELFRCTLEPFGYEVMTAATVEEALAQARHRPPDLIVSDVRLHNESGFELIESVRADPRLLQIPFIFLSSSVRASAERARGLSLGAVRFFSRPIEPVDLLAVIDSCLQSGG